MDLGFTPEWIESGVVTCATIPEFEAYAVKDPAKSARHWRWLAFRDFCEERAPLTADECRALVRLVDREADENLSIAMMCCVLYQRKCPSEIAELATATSRTAVRRTVQLLRAGATGEARQTPGFHRGAGRAR